MASDGRGKQYTVLRTHRHARRCVRCLLNLHHPARMSCFARCLTRHSSSLLFPSHWPTTSTPQTGLLFGRFAALSPLTGYEPDTPVDVSSTERTTMLLPSGKATIGSDLQLKRLSRYYTFRGR